MNTQNDRYAYDLGSKQVRKEDIRVDGKKIFIATDELDRELEIDVEVIENMIKVVKSKSE